MWHTRSSEGPPTGAAQLGPEQSQIRSVHRCVKERARGRVSEVAKKLGVSSQQGHGIAKRLRDRGLIKKQGKGYAVKP